MENFEIDVKVIGEFGYNQALFGLSLNRDKELYDNMVRVSKQLHNKDFGHNKFLEHIELWLSVRSPRYWWQEADTYRLASKNSQSTMNTILKKKLTKNNFENNLKFETNMFFINILLKLFIPFYLIFINILLKYKLFFLLKIFLLESFMQKRMWKMSYKTLRNIIIQRKNHRLPHWKEFIQSILNQVEHKELLPEIN